MHAPCGLIAVAVMAVLMSALPSTSAFQIFGGPASTGDTIRFLVRKVDEADPYYRSMSFFIPKELNYMLGEYLFKNFSRMLEMHCNVTNISMIVRNDVQLLLSDYDVWTMRNGDRIEIWSKLSGRPTRARTATAFTQKFRRPGATCPAGGSACPPGRGGGKWKTTGSADEAVPVPEESVKMEVTADLPPPEEPIPVPDWSQP